MYKLIAFDLDGTLTEHRTPIDDNNLNILSKIQGKYKTVIVGAGTCRRISQQLKGFPIDIIGNYGMQSSFVKNEKRIIKNHSIAVDKNEITIKIETIRKETGYTEYTGETVEFHDSGVFTFPLLGTKASLEEKIKFDPQRMKRKEIYPMVKDYFLDFNVFIGGSSSFDIVPQQFDKYKALMKYADEFDIQNDKILYVGDDFSEGGNDEQIFNSNIACVEIKNYKMLDETLNFLLK